MFRTDPGSQERNRTWIMASEGRPAGCDAAPSPIQAITKGEEHRFEDHDATRERCRKPRNVLEGARALFCHR